jgi:hypothetical protein
MISSEDFREEYNGNGSTDEFAYSWPVTNKTHLLVTKVVVATGAETTMVVDTDYTVNVDGLSSEDSADWFITAAVAPASGVKWVITPDLPLKQLTDFENQGGYDANTYEAAYDYLTILVQQLKEELDRCVKITVGSDTDPDDLISDLEDDAAAAAVSAAASAASAALAGSAVAEGVRGYASTSIAAADLTLVGGTDVLQQDVTGTLAAARSIIGSTTVAPTAGLAFNIYLNNVVVTPTNTLSFKSGATILKTLSYAGTYNGLVKLVSNGTAWLYRPIAITIS